jgi:hypothetical protein
MFIKIMEQVGQLTIEQKDQLVGQTYTTDSYFNPIEDCNNIWIISTEEIDFCDNPEFQWVKTLSLIDYCQKPELLFPPIG